MSEVFELLPAYKSAQHRYAGKIAKVETLKDHLVVTVESNGRDVRFLVEPYEIKEVDGHTLYDLIAPPENKFTPFLFQARMIIDIQKSPVQGGENVHVEQELEMFRGRCALVEGYYAVVYKNEGEAHHFSTCPASVFEKANAPFTSTAEYNEQLFADKLVENMEVLNNAHNALKDVTRLLTEQGYTLAAVQASRDVAYANAVQLAKNYGYGDAAIAEMSNVGGGYLGELLKHLSGAKDKINPIDRPETQDIVLKAVNAYLSDEAMGAAITNSDKDKIRKTVITILHKELSRRS